MVDSSSRLQTKMARADEMDLFRRAICPMCHTSAALTRNALDAGGWWRCLRCGQHWDAQRLKTVAAYATWVIERDNVTRHSGGPIEPSFSTAAG
jgi:ribosomal protein L37AE/L43A